MLVALGGGGTLNKSRVWLVPGRHGRNAVALDDGSANPSLSLYLPGTIPASEIPRSLCEEGRGGARLFLLNLTQEKRGGGGVSPRRPRAASPRRGGLRPSQGPFSRPDGGSLTCTED
ncbi:UNVERIFIED_CONTAM: hypothetical protein K2H54_062762 [Gekko kuhli]